MADTFNIEVKYPDIPLLRRPHRKARAVLCPVCTGRGTITNQSLATTYAGEDTCHGCHGSGWVTVYE
jgi:DnaJ-class molecular chaperone